MSMHSYNKKAVYSMDIHLITTEGDMAGHSQQIGYR